MSRRALLCYLYVVFVHILFNFTNIFTSPLVYYLCKTDPPGPLFYSCRLTDYLGIVYTQHGNVKNYLCDRNRITGCLLVIMLHICKHAHSLPDCQKCSCLSTHVYEVSQNTVTIKFTQCFLTLNGRALLNRGNGIEDIPADPCHPP